MTYRNQSVFGRISVILKEQIFEYRVTFLCDLYEFNKAHSRQQ